MVCDQMELNHCSFQYCLILFEPCLARRLYCHRPSIACLGPNKPCAKVTTPKADPCQRTEIPKTNDCVSLVIHTSMSHCINLFNNPYCQAVLQPRKVSARQHVVVVVLWFSKIYTPLPNYENELKSFHSCAEFTHVYCCSTWCSSRSDHRYCSKTIRLERLGSPFVRVVVLLSTVITTCYYFIVKI